MATATSNNDNASELSPPTRIILITYEFTFSTFSGNGILAISLVKSLVRRGCHVTVWCCRPPTTCTNDNDGQVPDLTEEELERLTIVSTTISTADKWRRLDDESAWEEFVWSSLSESSQATLAPSSSSAAAGSTHTAVLVIDWTGHHALKSTPFQDSSISQNGIPLIYLNFRVYSSGVSCNVKRKWYDTREKNAVQNADLVVALSEKDKASLTNMMMINNNNNREKLQILVPPLRGDVEKLAKQTTTQQSIIWSHLPPEAKEVFTNNNNNQPRKCFIACVVRLSPEKNTRRFVDFLKATRAFWKDRNWIPLLAGAASDPTYATLVKQELRDVCGDGCVIVDSFLSPASLAAVFACTILNFHPCSYDAYGMTIMEAAAFGVPSVVAEGNHVGATIHVGNGASIQVPMNDCDDDDDGIAEQAVETIVATLRDTAKLDAVGKLARQRALAWDEDAYGRALLDHIASLNN
ncbi:Glycosyl transferases group 1 [Seminavis robusta]|uniref:Glycosyl transferases group 1 n=1 Tax=Seminavis robusta TaxID=568900 RepID=A0A9N8E8K4_9STRA|nr:Glycosyl transferases group 1 [Seminavis robusta]|eukprot:Sro773_g200500.1 Glycosyl transferases group 1 (466) ;mRNA; r:34117-35607